MKSNGKEQANRYFRTTVNGKFSKRTKQVIAIEKDERLAEIAKELTKKFSNTEIVANDILQWQLPKPLHSTPYKLVGNLPYYAATPIIKKFLEEVPRQPKILVAMMQKEVAQRICANPPDMTLLSVSVQFYGTPSITEIVKKESFWPKPAVDSAILKIVPHQTHAKENRELFVRVVTAGFRHPRRQLFNNLVIGLHLPRETVESALSRCGIDAARRAETLSVQDWVALAKFLS